jgi:hypothetical protein
MKTSPLVLVGILASATCLSLWWWSGSRDEGGRATGPVSGGEVQGKPSGDAQPAGLEGSTDSHQREGAGLPLPLSAPAPAPGEVQPTPAAPTLAKSAFADAPLQDLINEAKRLRSQVANEAQPILNAQLAKGQAEFISTQQTYNGRKEDSTDICSIHYVPGSGLFRAVLSREAYPELYELKAQAEAIDLVVRDRQVEVSALNKAKKP